MGSYQQREDVAMAAQTLLSISRDEIERARILSEYKFAVDLQSKMVNAKREGRAESCIDVAKNALEMGMSIEVIAKLTHMPESDIMKLMDKNLCR